MTSPSEAQRLPLICSGPGVASERQILLTSVSEKQEIALGMLMQSLGTGKRPVGHLSKQFRSSG
jgi:hypothetical protein